MTTLFFVYVCVFVQPLLAQDDNSMTILLKAGLPPSGGVSISIDDVEGDESDGTFRFTLSLSEISEELVNVTFHILDDTALACSDYEAADGIIAIPPGSTSAELTVPILDDHFHESEETFAVELSEVRNASIEKSLGIGTIHDDDELPVLSIEDATAEEKSQTIVFTVGLVQTSAVDVGVEFATEDGTAEAGKDYRAKSGTVTIPAGKTSAAIKIAIMLDEATKEDDEAFLVLLSHPVNATLGSERGIGTIQNTHVSFVKIRKMVGLQVPEPSTYGLFLLGLLGIGALVKCRKG